MTTALTDDQRTELWFEARLGKATASNFSKIMAGKKYVGWNNYKAQLVTERLTGMKADGFTSKEMQWGIDYEEAAKLTYELETGNRVKDCGFFQHEFLDAGASPDGLVGLEGLVEIKCPNTATHIETLKSQKVPRTYYWQVMGQMWITGAQWCDFISYDPRMPPNSRICIIRSVRDEEAIGRLEEQVTIFLKEVESDEQLLISYKGASTK